jgi:hypothetical protein
LFLCFQLFHEVQQILSLETYSNYRQ